MWALRTLLGPNQQHWQQLIPNRTAAKGFSFLAALQIFVVVLLSGYGLWLLGRKNKQACLFLLIYCTFLWGTSAWFSAAYARFRAPFEFVLYITAALAVVKILSLQAHRKAIQ